MVCVCSMSFLILIFLYPEYSGEPFFLRSFSSINLIFNITSMQILNAVDRHVCLENITKLPSSFFSFFFKISRTAC